MPEMFYRFAVYFKVYFARSGNWFSIKNKW